MVTEALLIGSSCLVYNYWEEIQIRKKWKQIVRGINLYNHLGKTVKVWKYKLTEYGYDLTVELPYGYTMEKFQGNIDIFAEGLGMEHIELRPKGNMCIMRCVEKREFNSFTPFPLPPYKVLIADGLSEPIIVNLNEMPHILIGGTTGSGKTRILLSILTNLICCHTNIDIHLLQIRKNDLEVFEDCKQVKTMSKTLEEVRDNLKALDKEAMRRDTLIKPKNGKYNISGYNKANNNELNYIYIVFEEFSFLQVDKGDSKEDKEIKQECLKYIGNIARAGRSSGMFLIVCLQRPTNDSLPSSTKSMLNTCIAMRLKSEQESRVIIQSADAVGLRKREMIISTDHQELAYSFTIDHDIVMEYIQNSIIEKPKVQKPIQKKVRSKFFESNRA
ncbi:MAG: FtsK/SpoIIIE domain-containing protein [Aminipila sp.]